MLNDCLITQTNVSLLFAIIQVDKDYVGPILIKEVTFSNLNNNIDRSFLTGMCAAFGTVLECMIAYHPTTRKHLGIGKVCF